MKPAEAIVTEQDVELAERLNADAEQQIGALMSQLRSLLRQARITPKTIAQRAAFARLEAARIAAAPKLDDLITGVAEAAKRGEIRSPDHPEERAIDEAFMAWQLAKADGMANPETARAHMQALVDGELGARDAMDELRDPYAPPTAADVAKAIQVLDEEDCA